MFKNRIIDLPHNVRIPKGSVNTILKDFLCLRRVKSRLVPKTPNLLVTNCTKIRLMSFHNNRIRQIWHRVTSRYSIILKDRSTETVLSPLKTLNVHRCALWRLSWKRTFRSFLKIGDNVGMSVLCRRGIILKRIKLVWKEKVKIFYFINKVTFFFGQRSISFCNSLFIYCFEIILTYRSFYCMLYAGLFAGFFCALSCLSLIAFFTVYVQLYYVPKYDYSNWWIINTIVYW